MTSTKYYVFLQKKTRAAEELQGPQWIFDPLPLFVFAVLEKKAMFFSWKSAEQLDHLAPVRHALLVQNFKSAGISLAGGCKCEVSRLSSTL